MSSSDTNQTDESSRDGGASGGLLASVVPTVIRRNFALKFGIVLVVMALSVGSTGLLATGEVRTFTQNQVIDEYEGAAAQEGDIIEQWIERNRLSTQFVSSDDVWAGDDTDNLKAEVQNSKSGLSADAASIHLVERGPESMTVIASTSLPAERDLTQVGRPWVADVRFDRAGSVEMSNVYETDSGPVVGYMSPVSATQNRFIVVEYSVDEIASGLQGSDRADGGFSQVVNSSYVVQIDEPQGDESGAGDGTLTAYSNSDSATQPIANAETLRNTTQSAGVMQSLSASDVIGEEYTVGYAPIDGTDWVVLVHAPSSSLFGFVETVETWGFIGTGLMVLLIGGVGAALGYNTATSIDRLTRKTERMQEGNLDVDVETARIDNIGRLYEGFDEMQTALKRQISEAERARKEAEVSRAEAMEVNTHLQEKAEEFSDVMEAAAAGTLTERMETDGENEAMDRIASEFNGMINELEKTIGQLNSFADEVAESGDIVLASSESVRDASEQVADSVQKMSDDAYEQKERLQSVSEGLDDLVATLEGLDAEHDDVDFEDTIGEFRDVATTLQEAADTSEEMMAESETVAGAAEEQAAELNEVSSRAEKLKRYAGPLGDILDRFETESEHEFVFSGGPSQGLTQNDDN